MQRRRFRGVVPQVPNSVPADTKTLVKDKKRMDRSDIPARLLKREGIGARVPRKEDARHLVGKGNFVGDFVLPGMQEVAFLRSPLAHASITGVEIPDKFAGKVFLREMMSDAADIGSPSSIPTYQFSALPPLASGRVRHVGEAIAMAVAPTRAVAEDLLEDVQISYEELPVYYDVESALAATGEFMHPGGRTTGSSPCVPTATSMSWQRRRR